MKTYDYCTPEMLVEGAVEFVELLTVDEYEYLRTCATNLLDTNPLATPNDLKAYLEILGVRII